MGYNTPRASQKLNGGILLTALIEYLSVALEYLEQPVTRHFLAKLSICPAKPNLARQIYNTLSMKISLNLLKTVNVRTIFSPYHKHC